MHKFVLYKYILKLYFVIHKMIDRGGGYVYFYTGNMIFLIL